VTPNTLFGAPLGYSPDSLNRWIRLLEGCWIAFARGTAGELDEDLELLRPLFGAGANAKSLRATLAALAPQGESGQGLPGELALTFEDRALMTPEGRVLLEVLHRLQQSGENVIAEDQIIWAQHAALTARGAWGRDWAEKQLDGNMSPPVLGAACFLLVNGSIGPEHALRLPEDEREDRDLGRLVLPLVASFSETLGGNPPPVDSGLRSHWVFTQVSRLLPLDVRRERGIGGTSLYVRDDREAALLMNLRARLGKFDPTAVDAAVAQLVNGYRTARGSFIALDQSYEDPRHTQRVQRALTTQP
jgi:hypothetical protein